MDRFIFITGGTRGIGRAVTLSQAKKGTTLFVNYLRDEEAAGRTRRSAEAAGAEMVLLPGNIADSASVGAMFKKVRSRTSRLDALVHSAALGVFKPVTRLREKDWDISLDVNARAFLILCQEASGLMPKGGSIVALSSLGAGRYTPQYGAIGVSKAALESLVRYLAVELAPRGIRVNAVSGGLVDTDSLKFFPEIERMKKEYLARTPAGRIASPQDIARVVAFLLSPEAGWIYGQTLIADGGYSLS
ncbi:MAG: hypothetical protein A3D28_01220 [Omnitrophica bacterium RIFCSPHIGHO2_02_FULL_63_14]|nr:MAG: hypothetical protein A3D28_01220 [Omnitrophica bacterium RIFCSPHIGHO2_02_FULL_63_14]